MGVISWRAYGFFFLVFMLSTSNLKGFLPVHHVSIFLVELHDASMSRAVVDVLEELAENVFASLGFAFDLSWVSVVIHYYQA